MYIYEHIHMYTYICIYIYIHTYMHTYIHIHTYTYIVSVKETFRCKASMQIKFIYYVYYNWNGSYIVGNYIYY